MQKKFFRMLSVFMILSVFHFSGCSDSDVTDDAYQVNSPAEFKLMDVFDGYGALEEAWDSIDPIGVNQRLETLVNENTEPFITFSYLAASFIEDPAEPLPEMVRTDLRNIVNYLTNTNVRYQPKDAIPSFYTESGEVYASNFYAFLDQLSDGKGVPVDDDYFTGMSWKLLSYILDSSTKAEIMDDMDDLMEDIMDVEFQEDFIDLSKLFSKLLIRSDYSLWVDKDQNVLNYHEINPSEDTNLGLGNAVEGTPSIVRWLNRVMAAPDSREWVHGLIRELGNIMDSSREIKLDTRVRELICNIEDHFTIGGEVYESDDIYHRNDEAIYSNAEIGESIREFFPGLVQLMVRSDRDIAMIDNNVSDSQVYPMDLMGKNLRAIGFDPDTIDVDRSLDDLIRNDLYGRNRLTDEEAFPASMLESLLFLTAATSNHGWMDGEKSTGEFTTSSDPHSEHGHGEYTQTLSLNDSLFSTKTYKAMDLLSFYDLSFVSLAGNHLYRTGKPFTKAEVDGLRSGVVEGDDKDYRFFYDQNYSVLQLLGAPCLGDLGVPYIHDKEGNQVPAGNPDGNTIENNRYRSFAPTGLDESQLSSWTLGWAVRACYNGEGPYYYADPVAETATVEGKTYSKYIRPNGKVYALVNRDRKHNWEYLYPTETGDAEDEETDVLEGYNGKRQRYDRYRSKWKTDYYMSHYYTGSQHKYLTIDNSDGNTRIVEVTGNDGQAGCLTIEESIKEYDEIRACATPEEAFFRNYQYFATEKKMVLVVPLYVMLTPETVGKLLNNPIASKLLSGIFDSLLNAFRMGEGVTIGVVYQIQEAHGWSGLANMRKYAPNHVWAKKGETGLSTIPGDYRVELVSHTEGFYGLLALLGINNATFYDDVLGCGNATPSIVGHNLPALYRLGFPVSPEKFRGRDYYQRDVFDREVGSRDFQVGDGIWKKRNAFAPMLISLCAALREHTAPYDSGKRATLKAGIRSFVDGTTSLSKPLVYYQKDKGSYPHNTYKLRVFGETGYGSYKGEPYLQSSAEFYDDGLPERWNGSDEEQAHYQPARVKTLINMLIDSDLNDPEKRYDGILPLITRTHVMTNLAKVLLDNSHEVFNPEQLVTAIRLTKGEMTTINEGTEYGSAGSFKNLDFPAWMFAIGNASSRDAYGAYTQFNNVREEDFILDDLLDGLIGHDRIDAVNDGYGLAEYPDDKDHEEDWEDFNDSIDTMADLLHENSSYSITGNVLQLLDDILAKERLYTPEEIKGTLYSLGKLFAYYDETGNRWVYQGYDKASYGKDFNDIYNILKLRLPAIHDIVRDDTGDNYYNLLKISAALFDKDGLAEYVINTVSVPSKWEKTMYDLDDFLESTTIADVNSPLWTTLADLLNDLASGTEKAKDGSQLDRICESYGFQVN